MISLKKRISLLLLAGVLATLVLATPALATVYTYTAFALPRLCGNNYTSAHTKQTNDQYMRNTVTALSNTDLGHFWACNVNKSTISPGYDQRLGSTVDIRYNTYESAGTQVILGMQNAHLSINYAFVSGHVDMR